MKSQVLDPTTDQLKRAKAVHQKLLQVFGRPAWVSPTDPMNELISTILSQNTNDRNRDAAFNRIKQRFPTWEAVRDAPLYQVVDAIRTAGLANQKAARIQQLLKQITVDHGTLDLAFLKSMPQEEVHEWLLKFNGVGRKTSAIVMVFSLGMPAFPVDTHIYRVTGRIGLRPEKMTVEQAHDHLAKLFPPADYGPVHLNLIRLGREICKAQKPQCPICPVLKWCIYGQNRMKEANTDFDK